MKIERKSFSIKIALEKRLFFLKYTKNIILRYQQASIFETFRFIHILKESKPIHVRLIEFIEDKAKVRLSKDEQMLISKNRHGLLDEIKSTYFFGCFGSSKGENEDTNPVKYASFIDLACKELHIEPNKLLHEYTMEQVNYLLEGVIRNKNEQTEKGRKQNQMKLLEMKLENRSEEDRKRDEEFFSS